MNFRAVSIAAIAGAVLSFAGALQAQKRVPAPLPSGQGSPSSPIRAEVTRVNMLFTVTDKKGRFVTNLTKNDFQVFEDKKLQTILQFTSESDLPLRMAILIDTSNSIRERLHFQQQAAINFINGVMRDQDKATVISFDTSVEPATSLTGNTARLEDAIRNLRAGGGTALYDGIYFACKELMRDQPLYKFRRAMVILSDGEDNASRHSRDQALEMAQRADVVIYTISTNTSGLETDGDKVMRFFAQSTGGVVFFPFQAKDLDQSFTNIANELRHQYNIFYQPQPLHNDGKFHRVKIRVKGRKHLIVRCRKGYYASKEPSS
ncbi:MAG TPA: VWA domain-containing protein [Bryobacteraceae bacterium]